MTGSAARAFVARCAALALLVICAPRAWAARPFNTDDARIVEPGGYQIESYVRSQHGAEANELWFLPAHNFGGELDRLEWTLGGNVIRSDDNGNSNLVVGQVKALLVPLPDDGIGVALTLGLGRLKPGTGTEQIFTDFGPIEVPAGGSTKVTYNPYLNFITSLSTIGGQFVFHGNVGLVRDNIAGETQRTWGIGAELFGLARAYPIAEIYGASGQKPSTQVGVRIWARPNRFQVDGTYGKQNASPANIHWISIGVRLLW